MSSTTLGVKGYFIFPIMFFFFNFRHFIILKNCKSRFADEQKTATKYTGFDAWDKAPDRVL